MLQMLHYGCYITDVTLRMLHIQIVQYNVSWGVYVNLFMDNVRLQKEPPNVQKKELGTHMLVTTKLIYDHYTCRNLIK